MAARNYTNTHTATTLTGAINSSVTAITLASTAGLPVSYPYNLVIDYGAGTVEVVSVTSAGAGTTLNVTRGQDGTTAQSHNAGASVAHAVVAQDLKEPQDHIAASTNVHGLAGGAAVVGTTSTQTLSNKTISGASNTLSAIPDSAIVAVAASKVTQPFTGVSTGTVTATGNATIGGNLTVTGTVTAAQFTSSGLTNPTFTTLNVTGASTLTGNTTVGGTLGVTGTSTLGTVNSGNHAVTGTLSASGTTTLAAVNASGNATVGGTLGVTGTLTGTTINGSTDVQRNGVSLPRGVIGGKIYTNTADKTSAVTTEALANMDTGAVSLTSGRRYRIHIHIRLSTSLSSSLYEIALRDTNLAGTRIWQGRGGVFGTNTSYDQYFCADLVAASTASKTYAVTIASSGGNVTVKGADLTNSLCAVFVEDMGTNTGITTVP